MGLTIRVGYSEKYGQDRQDIERIFKPINQVLRACYLSEHQEPFPALEWNCDVYGYSGLHYLRRLAAHLWADGALPAEPGTKRTISFQHDFALADYYIELQKEVDDYRPGRSNHLMCHSDTSGFYLPLAFEKVLFPPALGLQGEYIGSTPQLQKECLRLAGMLALPEKMTEKEQGEHFNALEAQLAGQFIQDARPWLRYAIEAYVCRQLLAACQRSLATGCALRFS